MVTPADFAAFQQQLRQEVADVIQQIRAEVNETISGKMDMLNSINAALQNVSSHTRSVTSFQESGKAATKKESSGASCRTCRFEAWHATVRRCDQRNMSDKNSAYAALISNIPEKDRARDVEQFDDILRTFTNEMKQV